MMIISFFLPLPVSSISKFAISSNMILLLVYALEVYGIKLRVTAQGFI